MSIIGFENEQHGFLSNFYPNDPSSWYGKQWMTNEHFYQAHKTLDPEWFLKISLAATPALSKKLGRSAPMRPDWDHIKIDVMLMGLRMKFAYGTSFADRLVATGNQHLEEANWWGDTFWGTCKGVGDNWLGRCLMEVRRELQIVSGVNS